MEEERERRKKVRGKKRGAEDFSFFNEEFISSFQNRTNKFGDQPLESMFDGKDLTVDFEVSFTEATQEGGSTHEIDVKREVICTACNGTRERAGSQSFACYSCKGEGIKEDALFHKKTKCNTCKGHGKHV